jgi:hypothetical protein
MLQMHRVFCATPWELEAERRRFYDLLGEFNEKEGMSKGILFVPVTVVNIRDKRPLQYAIDENIRDARFYLQLLCEDWGPVERNFRRDYNLALQTMPAGSVAVLAKEEPGVSPAADLPEPQARFSTMAEFDQCVRNVLAAWFGILAGNQCA